MQPNSEVLIAIYPVLSKFYSFSRSLCLNERAVALKRPQVFENIKKVNFCKMRFIMKLSFMSLCFSGVLVFSVLYYIDIIICFTARAVAQNEWKILEWIKKWVFLKIILVMQMSFLRLCFLSVLVFSITHDFIRRLCFNARVAVWNERQCLLNSRKSVLSEWDLSYNWVFRGWDFQLL